MKVAELLANNFIISDLKGKEKVPEERNPFDFLICIHANNDYFSVYGCYICKSLVAYTSYR